MNNQARRGDPLTTPAFTHDCVHCTFLGHFNSHDLYHCEQIGNVPTVIARYGNDGPDYTSGLGLAQHVPELAEAKRRAKVGGLRLRA